MFLSLGAATERDESRKSFICSVDCLEVPINSKSLKRPGGDREMVDILALVLHHDEQAVLCTVEMALETGVPTKTHVLNVLHRLVDGKSLTSPTINAPQYLTLANEPKANVERYDLRAARVIKVRRPECDEQPSNPRY